MSPSEDQEKSPPRRTTEPKVFTPLPSTSRDTATFDLNEKMYVDIYGDAEDGDSSFEFLRDHEPPRKRAALARAPLEVNPEPRIDDDVAALALEEAATSVDVVSIDDVDIADHSEVVCCEKSDSDDEPLILNQSADVEIIESFVAFRRSKRKRKLRVQVEPPVVVLDSSDEDVVPIDSLRRAKRKSPVTCSPTPSNDSASAESCADANVGSLFDPLLTFIGDMIRLEGKQNLRHMYTIVDTVDLSDDSFKPTPIVDDVIVIDSDTPVRAQPPAANPRPSHVNVGLADCPVCLESFSSSKPTASTFCGHIFCKPCMVAVMNTSKKCPTCRQRLKGKGFHLLYL